MIWIIGIAFYLIAGGMVAGAVNEIDEARGYLKTETHIARTLVWPIVGGYYIGQWLFRKLLEVA